MLARVWSFIFFFLLAMGKVEEEEKKLRSHWQAIPMLYQKPQRKNSFDTHVLTMAEGMMETRVIVNGILLRVSKSIFCCLQNFLCSLEENLVSFSNIPCGLSLASLTWTLPLKAMVWLAICWHKWMSRTRPKIKEKKNQMHELCYCQVLLVYCYISAMITL